MEPQDSHAPTARLNRRAILVLVLASYLMIVLDISIVITGPVSYTHLTLPTTPYV